MQLRRVLALCIAAAIIAPAPSAWAQRNNQQQQQPKRSKAEQADIEALSSAVDYAAVGKTATDVTVKWEMHHFLKNPDGSTVFPFVISVDKATLPANQAAMYVRIMDKEQIAKLAELAAAAAAPEKKDSKDDPKTVTPPTYAWQNIYFLDVPADGKISRAVALPPGDYEMFIAIKEKAKDEKSKTPPKIGVLQKSLKVPDFTTGLTTSEIIVAKSIEQLQQPLPADKAAENPYVFGPLRISPTMDGKFAKTGEMSVVFWIYNAGVSSLTNKPDVQVEYNFHQKNADGTEKFFNKTAPTALNATTLPAEFDLAKGHQLTEIQSIPLSSFPPGDYRLEIKVTDKTDNRTVTQNVNFNVAAS